MDPLAKGKKASLLVFGDTENEAPEPKVPRGVVLSGGIAPRVVA